MKTVRDIKDLKGKRVLMRVDFNVPIEKGRILNTFRIDRVLPTIKFLRDRGAHVILLAHIGRAKNATLKPVARYLDTHVETGFIPGAISKKHKDVVDNMKDGGVILFENIRVQEGEMKNTKTFTKQLASLGDVYVNEAFSVSHREHASIVGLPSLLPAYAGLLFEEEVQTLSRAFDPHRPFVFILGGAKFKTKLPLIKMYLKKADQVFVGGALAHTFFKELGMSIGKSLYEAPHTELESLLKNSKLLLPSDVRAKKGEQISVRRPGDIQKGETIVDIGPETEKELTEYIKKARCVIFNGPLGNYEIGFDAGTRQILKAMQRSSAYTIIGGGDTVSVHDSMRGKRNISFVSTGGGAMLAFLVDKTLPGIKALKQAKRL